MRVYGEAEIAEFSRKYATSRKPLQRFLAVAREAEWPHFPAIRRTFPSADYAPATGTVIFDIGGNKYRLITRVDFDQQALYIERVSSKRAQRNAPAAFSGPGRDAAASCALRTHEQYDRENQ